MGIFSDIIGKIFHHAAPAEPAATEAVPAPAGTPADPPAAPPVVQPLSDVDVEAVMDNLVDKAGQDLNWRTSIVDMLKALSLDSSLDHRRALAGELHYDGDTDDTATMNTWLIKQVLHQLSENGGKLPADLLN